MTNKKTDLRKQAEAKAFHFSEGIDALSPAEIRQTLHELRVHQIELEMQNEELRMMKMDGTPFWVRLKTTTAKEADGTPVSRVAMSADRRLEGAYREISREVLQILNEPGNLQDSIQRLLASLKMRTGFDAVGIRLQDADDFPYFAQTGFTEDFLRTENTLIGQDEDGGTCRDEDGSVCLECNCGLVISGKTDPFNPLLTPGGSFWTNYSLRFPDIQPAQDTRRHHHPRMRDRCAHQGYASVALVPIRNKERVVGLLQFNDRRMGLFNIATVEHLEGVALHIGAALMRTQAEEALSEARKDLEKKVHERTLDLEIINKMLAVEINDHKQAAEENLLLERQLRQAQKMEAIGTLAGGIAHDFNNILGAISGFTELALARAPAGSKEKRYLNRIFTATQRAVDLVSQILAFSRQTEKELRPLRLNPIIKEVIKLIRATTPTTITIHQNITAEPDLVMADATYIHQVILNLCMNANHAMLKKGGVLSVSSINENIVSDDMNHLGVNPGPYLKLTVSDTGEGIEMWAIDKIFDPFFTTKKHGEGTGLGLSVVHGIVTSLGGEIKVDSRVGQGTSFSVWFPMLADSLLEDFPEGEDTISFRGSGRILFVDDEEALVEMATDMLESLGYEVTASQGSLEALEIFRANPDRFDLVITDQTMPEITGMALAQKIIKIRPGTPIILCTGFSSAVNAGEAKNAGIRDFVIKPMIKNKIAESIHQILENTPQILKNTRFTDELSVSIAPRKVSSGRRRFEKDSGGITINHAI